MCFNYRKFENWNNNLNSGVSFLVSFLLSFSCCISLESASASGPLDTLSDQHPHDQGSSEQASLSGSDICLRRLPLLMLYIYVFPYGYSIGFSALMHHLSPCDFSCLSSWSHSFLWLLLGSISFFQPCLDTMKYFLCWQNNKMLYR